MVKEKRSKKKSKVAIALSGGVDSGVAAALLKEQGYQLVGFHLLLWSEKNCHRCCGGQLLAAARKTAQVLEIPFFEIDLKKVFKEKVVDKFLEEHRAGRTPNPCVLCNKFVRFGKAFEIIKKKLGCEYLATGHYSRIATESKEQRAKIYHLLQAKDKQKDQSYFLYRLKQKQLARLIFPLGDWQKKEVWRKAKKMKLPVVESQESFDICFTFHLEKFLRKRLAGAVKPGKMVDFKGEILGTHRGLALYTIGSRGGWDWDPKAQQKFSKKGHLPKFYVAKKGIKKNQLIVGTRKQAERKEFSVGDLSWINPLTDDEDLFVRIRSSGKLLKCRVKPLRTTQREVVLVKPELGIASGQSAVFYRKFGSAFEVLGGGVITN